MRLAMLVMVLALGACEQPTTKAPPAPEPTPAPDIYADQPQCKAQCEDRISRVRCDPPSCPTLEDCMATCREPPPEP